MGARGKAGWIVAAIVAVGWWSSGERTMPPTRQAPLTAPVKSPAAVPAQDKPDAIARPSKPPRLTGGVQWLYTKANARVRDAPSTSAPVLLTIPAGELVQSNHQQGEWHNVTVQARVGWIRGDLLTTSPPQAQTAAPTAPVVSAPMVRRAAPPPSGGSGTPVREPYVGTCDCPYDLMRNGRRCGGNSAYSRPGGRNPVCYL